MRFKFSTLLSDSALCTLKVHPGPRSPPAPALPRQRRGETQPREDSNELRLPGHQQCATHVLHLVSGDVDTALGKLKEGELEGRPEAYRSAMGKLGVLWRVKRKSSQASMVLVGCTLNHLCFAPLVFGKICVLGENR